MRRNNQSYNEAENESEDNIDIQVTTIGEYVLLRLKEEKLTLKDLDADTIDFFYQQWLVENNEDDGI